MKLIQLLDFVYEVENFLTLSMKLKTFDFVCEVENVLTLSVKLKTLCVTDLF